MYTGLLPGTKTEHSPDHAAKFRDIMYIPIDKVAALSKTIGKFAELYEKVREIRTSSLQNCGNYIWCNTAHRAVFLKPSEFRNVDYELKWVVEITCKKYTQMIIPCSPN